jgi:hypothetical protein
MQGFERGVKDFFHHANGLTLLLCREGQLCLFSEKLTKTPTYCSEKNDLAHFCFFELQLADEVNYACCLLACHLVAVVLKKGKI